MTRWEFAGYAAIQDGDRVSLTGLAAFIETTFRAAYVMMSILNENLLEIGEGQTVDAPVAEAEEMQAVLLGGSS